MFKIKCWKLNVLTNSLRIVETTKTHILELKFSQSDVKTTLEHISAVFGIF